MPLSELRLIGPNTLQVADRQYTCTIGRGGIAALDEKREGDLKTPQGRFFLRNCYYRPDRLALPVTALPVIALTPEDGWCDDVAHPSYNLPVKLPFAARHENLWREDGVYDLIIPLGYNDGYGQPIVAGAGSAIFMHIMREDGVGTEGCVALKKLDLLEILKEASSQTAIII